MNMSFTSTEHSTSNKLLFLYLLAMLLTVAAILTGAMVMQYAYGELPCPLCLLQRLAMFGVCMGIMLQFRYGYQLRHTAISLLFSLLLLFISARQTLLDIYPRPGHEYIGSAVFGIHMPVWSVFISLALLLAIALQLLFWGNQEGASVRSFPTLHRIASAVAIFVVAIGVINTVSVGIQCGVNECHTFNYQLLQH